MKRPWARRNPDAEERLLPGPTSHWWGEHRSRYQFAARHAAGRTVLDIACGTGFGSRILLDAGARFVVAADLFQDAAREAGSLLAEAVGRGGACVTEGSRLALKSGSIDLVASFETLEHVTANEEFLDELRRVLAPDGLLVLSTPNALISKPVDGKPRNPFHVREFEPRELEAALRARFSDVKILGQRIPAGYRFTPIVELRADMPTDLRTRLAFLSWRIQHHLPFAIKDRWSRLVQGHGFYPGENEWRFVDEGIEGAHALVALCRP